MNKPVKICKFDIIICNDY